MPSRARASNVSMSTAVSGSQAPSGRRPKQYSKSRIPQRSCVCLSRGEAGGRGAGGGGWQVIVVKGLSERGPVAEEALNRLFISLEDSVLDGGLFVGEPLQEG